MKKQTITFIGDGSWGTTLAVYLSRKGYNTVVWGAFSQNIKAIQRSRENKKFLPGIKIPKNVYVTDNIHEAVDKGDILVLATPSQYLTGVLKKIKKTNYKNKPILSIVKGIDTSSLKRVSEMVKDILGPVKFAVLSGPTIAKEVALNIPSTAVIASKHTAVAKTLQKIFHSQNFRIYTSTDVCGVEVGGSLKNVIAIACGVCDGLGFGTNTKSAILARGLVEISRLGAALGAKRKTFSGLTGLGDLVTTCFSERSRNRSVGQALGEGKSIQQILSHMAMVAEGVETVKAVIKLSKKYTIDMPISQEVYNIIYRKKRPQKAVMDLMSRRLKSE